MLGSNLGNHLLVGEFFGMVFPADVDVQVFVDVAVISLSVVWCFLRSSSISWRYYHRFADLQHMLDRQT